MNFLRGHDRTQSRLLPASIEEYVAEDSLVRVIAAFVETVAFESLGFARARPNSTGRPGYHPADMLGLYIYGYVNRIRSSRRLESEAHRNVEVMWLMRDLRPDFKTISEFRRRNIEVFPLVLREFNMLCRTLDLFGAELVAIDGSRFKASNNFHKSYNAKQLRDLIARIDAGIAEYLTRLEEGDREAEGTTSRAPGSSSPADRQAFQDKLSRLQKEKQECQSLLETLLTAARTPQSEEEDEEKDEEKDEESMPAETNGARNDISRTDGDSRRVRMTQSPGTMVGYNVQAAVDSRFGLIVTATVVPEANDLNQLSPMTRSTVAFFNHARVSPEGRTSAPMELTVLADSGYCEADHLADCEKQGVIPIVPRRRTTMGRSADGKAVFAKDEFRYDAQEDIYICPAGQEMTCSKERNRNGKISFDYFTTACTACPLKSQCTKARYRIITRRSNEAAVERSHERLRSEPGSMSVRKGLVEKIFGTLRMWGHDEFLLRGLKKVRGEFALSATAYNLRRCINILGTRTILQALNTA